MRKSVDDSVPRFQKYSPDAVRRLSGPPRATNWQGALNWSILWWQPGDLPWEVLRQRLTRDHSGRPLYDDTSQAKQLFEERLPHYRCASVQVSLTGDEDPDEVAGRVVETLREAQCAI